MIVYIAQKQVKLTYGVGSQDSNLGEEVGSDWEEQGGLLG